MGSEERKLTEKEFNQIFDVLFKLMGILKTIGITELTISELKKQVLWDVRKGGLINPKRLGGFRAMIDTYFELTGENPITYNKEKANGRRNRFG